MISIGLVLRYEPSELKKFTNLIFPLKILGLPKIILVPTPALGKADVLTSK